MNKQQWNHAHLQALKHKFWYKDKITTLLSEMQNSKDPLFYIAPLNRYVNHYKKYQRHHMLLQDKYQELKS